MPSGTTTKNINSDNPEIVYYAEINDVLPRALF